MADSFTTPEAASIPKAAAEFLALTEATVEPSPGAQLNLLVVDSEEQVRRACRTVGAETGMRVMDAGSAEDAMEALRVSPVDVLLTELHLPGTDGLELMKQVMASCPDVAVVVMTQSHRIDSAVRATRMGAADYVTKPFRMEELRARLEQVAHAVELKRENRLLREQVRTRPGFGGLVGMSPRMERVYKMIEKVAKRDHPVLVLGESGTGKELVARSIHYMGSRKDKPFVPVECSALVPTLVESELFGYTRGAFTGALQGKQGLMESANGGTLFLDEIGELPLESQVKLLRLIQHGEVERVGATATQTINVRIIAATHRNLQAMVEDGAFREDLYYRLAVVPLYLPPLREHKEDIPELVEHLFYKAKDRHRMQSVRVAPSIARHFSGHRWSGNIREMENVIERMLVLSNGEQITEDDLPEELRSVPVERAKSLLVELPENGISLEGIERELLLRALDKFHGNQTQAARYLDISRRTLIYRMEKHGLREESN